MTEQYHKDNPAGRLLAILEEFQRLASESERNQNKQRAQLITVRRAVAQYFDIPEKDHRQVLACWTAMMLLPGQILTEVSKLPVTAGLTEDLPDLEAALTRLALDQRVQAWVQQQLKPEFMKELKTLAMLLSDQWPQPLIAVEKLANLRKSIVSLMDTVAADRDLNPELRAFLQDHLHAMLYAVNTYPITGVQALQYAAKTFIGDVWLTPEPTRKSYQGSKFWKPMVKIIAFVSLIAKTGNETIDLVKGLAGLFGVAGSDLNPKKAIGPSKAPDDGIQDGEIVEEDELPPNVE